MILVCLLVLSVSVECLQARQETVYMSVLNSRKHRLGAQDNPTVGLFVSRDGGTTWEHKGWTGYIRTFYTEAGSDGAIWSACGNGVLRSADRGNSWRITTGWEITEVLKIKVDRKNSNIALAATAYGVFKTTNAGESWQEHNKGFLKPFVSDVVIDEHQPDKLLAATEDGLYLSTNGGAVWHRTGIDGKGVRTIMQHPLETDLFFAGTEDDGVFVSRDGGIHWTATNNGLTNLTVYCIACDQSSPDNIYVGTHGGGVYRSSDRGKTWTQKSEGLSNLVIHSLAVLPSNPSVLFAGSLNGGLFKSSDGGGHWMFNSQEEAQVWGLWAK
jgi:photosystem II stability/assembly factor-like uncharacterized protein